MTRTDLFGGLLLAAGFGAVLWEASSFQYGAEFAPGPGFAPVWLGGIGIVLALLVVFGAVQTLWSSRLSPQNRPQPLDRVGLARVGATLVGLVMMAAIAPWLGLVPSTFVFLLFLTLGVQRLSIPIGIGASVGTVLFIYLVFVRFLGVPIPSGFLGI